MTASVLSLMLGVSWCKGRVGGGHLGVSFHLMPLVDF